VGWHSSLRVTERLAQPFKGKCGTAQLSESEFGTGTPFLM